MINTEASYVNTSYPGFIYNFDPSTQLCDVKLAIEILYAEVDSLGYQTSKRQLLPDIPVQFVQGGGWSLTFPIPDGTPCYVHFAQRGIDHWVIEGKDEAGLIDGLPAPEFNMFHSQHSAVAIVGINPITNAISNFVTDGVELRNNEHDQIISLKENGSVNLITGSSNITINKDGDVSIFTSAKATIKADSGIVLDGDVTATKTLTVAGESNLNGGVNAKGGSGEASMSITGKMKITETINDVQIETHQHPYDWTDGSGSSDTKAPITVASVSYSLHI